MKLSQDTSLSMPIKNMIGILAAVAAGVWAWADITSRLTSLETAKQLMQQDLYHDVLFSFESAEKLHQ